MNTIIQNVRDEINKAENQLVTMATECIANGTTNNSHYNCVVANIAALSQMENMLKTEKTKDEKKPVTKSDKIKTSLVINGKPITCIQNKDVVINVCKHIVRHNFKQLNAIESKLISEITGKNFASNSEQENFIKITSGKKNFYFDTKKMISNNFMLLKKMLKLLEIPESVIQVA